MAIVTTDDQHYTDIAAAIRGKTGTETTYTPSEMPDGVNEVYEAGQKSEYDRFWDEYQDNGNRDDYAKSFVGFGWHAGTFAPKYNLTMRGANEAFSYCQYNGSLKELLEKQGITLTFPNTYNIGGLFQYSLFTEIGVLDFSTVTHTAAQTVFYKATALHTIEKIILPSNVFQSFTNWFNQCFSLENITFEGEIAVNGLVFNVSPLSRESLLNVIACLTDYSASSETHTVTFGTTNLAKLTDEEKAIATEKGWTLA